MQRKATSAAGRALRAGLLLACFAAGLGGVIAFGVSWLADARLGRPTLAFNFSRMTGKRLPELAEASRRGEPTVAMLGASALVSYPEGRGVPERLQERLQADPGARVFSLGMPGSGPFEYYFLADRIARAKPSLVVIALNLDHLSSSWNRAYARPELAGLLAPRRLPEALGLPLHGVGLTADRLLYYVAVVQAGGYDPWYWLSLRQAQVGRAWARLEARLQGGHYDPRNDSGDDTPERLFRGAVRAATVERVFSDPQLGHYLPAALDEHYGEVLAGLDPASPVLQVLDATVARFLRDGIHVLVYVEPLDVEYLHANAPHGDRDGLQASLSRIGDRVAALGGDFVDLHDALPPDAFRDAPGHLAWAGDVDGPARLAEILAPRVRAALRDGAR
jgi:hypothetical protein